VAAENKLYGRVCSGAEFIEGSEGKKDPLFIVK
jgi:hypothetical protein